MSELNQDTQATSQAPTQQSTAKTYMERLLEMESKLATHSTILNQAQVVYEFLSKVTTDVVETIRTLDEQLNAVYELASEGKLPTKENVEQKLKDRVEKSLRDMVDSRVASGLLTAIDLVEAKENLITYSKSEVPYAFRIVNALDDKSLIDQAIGKKIGDTLGDMTIVGIYKVNQPAQPSQETAPQIAEQPVSTSDQPTTTSN